jgi:hypothetical protein
MIGEHWFVNSPVVPDGISVNQTHGYVPVGAGDYHGKTIVLIEGRTLSAAENLVLCLKATGAVTAVLSVEFRVLSEGGNRFYSKLTTHNSKPQELRGRIFTAQISRAQLLLSWLDNRRRGVRHNVSRGSRRNSGDSGCFVREPNGRNIQRAGIRPDVQIEPTIEGIRAGRDEVLDGAINVVSQLP